MDILGKQLLDPFGQLGYKGEFTETSKSTIIAQRLVLVCAAIRNSTLFGRVLLHY